MNIRKGFDGSTMWREKLMYLSVLAIYFPNVDTFSDTSGFIERYLILNTVHAESSFPISYYSFISPFSSISVMYTIHLWNIRLWAFWLHPYGKWEFESEYVRQLTSIHSCFRVLCQDERYSICITTSQAKHQSHSIFVSQANIVMKAWSINFLLSSV